MLKFAGTIIGLFLLLIIIFNILIPTLALSTGFVWTRDSMSEPKQAIVGAWDSLAKRARDGSAVITKPTATATPPANYVRYVTRPGSADGAVTIIYGILPDGQEIELYRDYPEPRPDGSLVHVRYDYRTGKSKDLAILEPAKVPVQPTPAPVHVSNAPASAPSSQGAQARVFSPAPPQVSCDSQKEQHKAVVGQGWTPSGDWRIVNFWTNEAGHAQGERKLLLAPGQNPVLFGGGSSWSWPAACEATVRGEFAKNSLPGVSLDQLRAEGLAR